MTTTRVSSSLLALVLLALGTANGRNAIGCGGHVANVSTSSDDLGCILNVDLTGTSAIAQNVDGTINTDDYSLDFTPYLVANGVGFIVAQTQNDFGVETNFVLTVPTGTQEILITYNGTD